MIQQIGNMQTIITNDKTENEAVKIANNIVHSTYITQGQKLKIIDLDTIYQGNDTDQKALVNLAKQI
jgi:hypothetical protein